MDKRCLHVCYDCLCLIALFHDAMIFVHDWSALSMWIMTVIRNWRTITWELACLGSISPACCTCMARFFCRNHDNGGEIKDFVAVMMPSRADDILSLLSACVCGTSVSVIAPGMHLILGTGRVDCVGGPLGCSDWLILSRLMSSWLVPGCSLGRSGGGG